jgi:hypothetical protein
MVKDLLKKSANLLFLPFIWMKGAGDDTVHCNGLKCIRLGHYPSRSYNNSEEEQVKEVL